MCHELNELYIMLVNLTPCEKIGDLMLWSMIDESCWNNIWVRFGYGDWKGNWLGLGREGGIVIKT